MSTNQPLVFEPLTTLSRKIHSREMSSYQLVSAFIRQIENHNSKINAVVTLTKEKAVQAARDADLRASKGKFNGPLHGIPFLIKDSMRVSGVRSTFGFPQFKNYTPKSDSELVRRLRSAGGIVLGRSNVPFATFDWQCKSPIFGETYNPWDTRRTCGGSSGGAAASLAAGFTPFEIGSDIAGSIRWPAHCCGVFGFRPTEGLLPLTKMFPEVYPEGKTNLVVCGPMTRTAEDLVFLMNVLTEKPIQEKNPYQDLNGAKIAWWVDPCENRPNQETMTQLSTFVAKLGNRCHLVQDFPDKVSFDRGYAIWGMIAGYEYAKLLPFPVRQTRHLLAGGVLKWIFGRGPLIDCFGAGIKARKTNTKKRSKIGLSFKRNLITLFQSMMLGSLLLDI